MPKRDHYSVLRLSPHATLSEIKKAYRNLAFKYHPDKNPDDEGAAAQFRELQEAYDVLSDVAERARYDDERWMTSMGGNKQAPPIVTSAWLVNACMHLNTSLAAMDSHSISPGALKAYILLILSDHHITILQQTSDRSANEKIISEIIRATGKLRAEYLPEIIQHLIALAGSDASLTEIIHAYYDERQRKAYYERLFPYVIILVTLALCVFMYLFGRIG